VEDITAEFWENRMEQIRNFEKHITQNGIILLKFFCMSKGARELTATGRKASTNWH
jgi:polyphosphate kinase 2 (PPK2 family)